MSLNNLIDSLSTQGWYVWDDFLNLSEIEAIKGCIPDNLHDARIGNGESLHGNKAIRGDQTIWLESEMGEPIASYMAKMDEIRQALNRSCYMGLRDFETHFCRYPNGAFYKKHVDNFQGQGRRKVTTVLYMNEAWKSGDGGELVVYDQQDNKLFQLDPLAGRMIVFMSEEFPHEVLPTQQKRESIAGWFLTEKIL
ncbi:TPA: 2OG-Fe(II) oxygenase [Providencia stuartii]|uniref:Oxidoreductase, 2OG-Fe(II) oxygenase family protein n=1 Tax=Providencia stuartii ATCC 25827 TaxID=471874 RepID=A0AA86YUU6_PROST|nr:MULTISPECIES: 2OG-Fe(II) oxygenase [Providencia]EDU58118.1 oxidoreductase, 2OG-Fe(II) oxygenase family protein [Providencia stuartii ATCC 25827]QPN40367.1 2OG-Fe(II) oxygenase [Providencia sp. 2.29]SST03793.1 proline hydroxylase [Acinetobacter baumannii]AMG67459.1 SM-20 protein [Providencia stuartii]APG52131.1 SM-20 protein [Providencia stuartii]